MTICDKCGAEMPDGAKYCNNCGVAYKPQPAGIYSQDYDVFLSYRRDGGETMAILLRDRLTNKGYRVFLDIESLNAGSFNTQLLSVIEGCNDVVVICSKGALDRCINSDDWVRAEIAHAFNHNKNVVPIMLRGFEWPSVLPEEIDKLRMQNGVVADRNEYFDAAIDRLAEKFLLSKPIISTQTTPHQSVQQQPVKQPQSQTYYAPTEERAASTQSNNLLLTSKQNRASIILTLLFAAGMAIFYVIMLIAGEVDSEVALVSNIIVAVLVVEQILVIPVVSRNFKTKIKVYENGIKGVGIRGFFGKVQSFNLSFNDITRIDLPRYSKRLTVHTDSGRYMILYIKNGAEIRDLIINLRRERRT